MADLRKTDALTIAKEGFIEIGYSHEVLQEQYTFSDFLVSNRPLRHVDLAIFAQEPTSYHNSCFGFVTPQRKGREAILDYKALGAPQIFSLYPDEDKVYRWQVLSKGLPEFIETIDLSLLSNAIRENQAKWNPQEVLRAKSIRFTGEPTQLDFFDIGLVPALEDRVHEKLGKLLSDVIANCKIMYEEHRSEELDYKSLFRLIFRLIAAKLLADRQYPGNWSSDNAQEVISAVEKFYSQYTSPASVLNDKNIQNMAWKKIRTAFSFQNLSVETLAYVYENTLVSSDTRKAYGTHATPPQLAEYIVQNLPLEELAQEERYIFEPFCGHAPFLTAALGKLRTLLPRDMDVRQRHDYFVHMLAGMDSDPFACEVARYCLILADYPNPNGWHIEDVDIFDLPSLSRPLSKANVVLCNPPYEAFTQKNRRLYNLLQSNNKAVEALNRILQNPPKMLGLILPRTFISGSNYRQTREQIEALYNYKTQIELPDNVFNYSDAESVMVIAHDVNSTQRTTWQSFSVNRNEYKQFVEVGHPIANKVNTNQLQNIWDALVSFPKLMDIAEVRLGIRYNIPFDENRAELISEMPKVGFAKGLIGVKANDFEPYITQHVHYLNMEPEKMYRKAYKLAWEKPKIIVNAGRKSRASWTIVATVDDQKLVCYQNFHGIWPRKDMPLEVIAAIINGPVANAFLSTQEEKRHNQIMFIEQIPIPELEPRQIHLIMALVQEYTVQRSQWLKELDRKAYFEKRCRGLIKRIDGEILSAYNLDLSLEQELVAYFAGQKRPGPVDIIGIELSPTKRFYTSLIRIEEIRNEREGKVVDATIMNWNPHQIVHLPITLIPESIQSQLERDTWLLAEVTAGASVADALIFRDIQLAPK